MSAVTLNVWITNFGDPCHLIQETATEKWYVHIVDCAGNALKWCGKTYTFMYAKCGHLEVEIPPGCYAVFAGHSASPGSVPPFGNRLTHVQVVRANCGDHVCVTLFSPTLWYCGTWFAHAVATQLPALQQAKVDAKIATAATQAVQALLDKIPADAFTANTRRALEKEPAE